MHANSRIPISAQETTHEHLATLLERHRHSSFRKPYANYNRLAFAASIERWQRLAPSLPLILDAGCGTGESSLMLATLFPGHYVIGVDQSPVRLRRRIATQDRGEPHRSSPLIPSGLGGGEAEGLANVGFVRADLVDYWRLLRDAGRRGIICSTRIPGPRLAICLDVGTDIPYSPQSSIWAGCSNVAAIGAFTSKSSVRL